MKTKSPEIARAKYLCGNTFLPYTLAQDILQNHFFKTMRDNNEIYVYKNGAYSPKGKPIISEDVQNLLMDQCTNHREREVMGQIRRLTYANRDEFNTNKNLINLQNGLYNLKESRLEPHSPEVLFTTQLPIKYDKNAQCPKLLKFLEEVLYPESIPVIQELFGYLLHKGHPIQKAFLFLGGGANGKSTEINLIKEFLGKDNISATSLNELSRNRFAPARLFGKAANLYADLSDAAIVESAIFKMLTGEDTIETERKFKDEFNFVNFSKQIFSANQLPPTKDDSYAFYRRWILIDFPNTFEGEKANKNLLKELTSEGELSGIFNWALIGLKRLFEQGDFSYGITTEDIKARYERLSNPVAAFVNDWLDEDPEMTVTKEKLYTTYTCYCKKHRLPRLANNAFGRKLKALNTIRISDCKSAGKPAYGGINIKEGYR